MIRVNILYPKNQDSWFNMSYYCEKHIPMMRKLLGSAVKGVTVEHGLGGTEPGSPPSYMAMGHILFESVEAFIAACTPHAPTLMDDIKNYTNVQPTIQFSEVKMS